jgi:hypothetical protein
MEIASPKRLDFVTSLAQRLQVVVQLRADPSVAAMVNMEVLIVGDESERSI